MHACEFGSIEFFRFPNLRAINRVIGVEDYRHIFFEDSLSLQTCSNMHVTHMSMNVIESSEFVDLQTQAMTKLPLPEASSVDEDTPVGNLTSLQTV